MSVKQKKSKELRHGCCIFSEIRGEKAFPESKAFFSEIGQGLIKPGLSDGRIKNGLSGVAEEVVSAWSTAESQ